MSRRAAVVFLLSFGVLFQLSRGIEVNVKHNDKLCLYANFMLNFSVSYKADNNETRTSVFQLPADAAFDGSDCDTKSSALSLKFGKDHLWNVDFSLDGDFYHMDSITFSYDLSDSLLFPNSSSKEVIVVTQKPQITDVKLNTGYSCLSEEIVQADSVTMTLWNVLMQAFITDGEKSNDITSCAMDILPVMPTTTTPVPTTNTTTPAPTTNTTTPAPTTNTTTPAPTTNTTTPAPTTNTTTPAPATNTTTPVPATNTTTAAPTSTTPTPTLPAPSTGKYNITKSNDTICLLANFGLRIGFKQDEKYQEMNLDPSATKATGSCGEDSSELELESEQMTLTFTFSNDTKKFLLHALNVTVKTSSGSFFETNSNLSLWETSLGSSYMCNKEQNNNISTLLTLYTFNLQVQPFGVTKNVFSTAHECSLDDTSILIPIIVGAALAGLILIVVIAYVIGRRRTYVGYQTL